MTYEYPWTVDYDHEAGAAYIRLSDQSHHKTMCFGDRVNVDVDIDGEVIGIEILD